MIACAGPLDADRLGPNESAVDWLSIAGRLDFNYCPNRAMVRRLVERGVAARFETFDGGHDWPSVEVAARALAWLELSAMRNGARAVDPAFVDRYRRSGVARALGWIQERRIDDAAEEYAALARELRGLSRVDDLAAEAHRLHETSEAKRDRKHEAHLCRKDQDETERLFGLVRIAHSQGSTPPSDTVLTARIELETRIRSLRKDQLSDDAEKRLIARRVLDGFRVAVLYDGIDEEEGKGGMRTWEIGFASGDLPDAVRGAGGRGYRPFAVMAAMVKVMQEQQATIERLEERVRALESER